MKPNKLPLFELMIEDENTDEIFAISLVSEPAIELDFQYFGKELVKFAEVNNEKRLIMGPILVPNKKILRIDGEGKEYMVFFKPSTVRRLAEMYLEKKYTDKTTIEHERSVKGVNLVESWIVDNKFQDKSKAYGFQVPEGTWMGTFRVDKSPEGEKIWQEIKSGKSLSGFSIEGLFSHNLVAASKMESDMWEKNIDELTEEEAEVFLRKLKAIIKKDRRFKEKKRVEMESYSDYGDGVKNNAKKGIELNETNGNKCATQTGKVRAQQLANGEPISLQTVKRMYSYLSRAEVYYDNAESTSDCGYISYLLWGGKAALGWSRNKLRELGELVEGEGNPSITSSYPGEAAGTKKKKKYTSPAMFSMEEGNINVFGIETEYFYMCPGATALFNHLVTMPVDEDTKGMIRSAALIADRIFDIEEDVIEEGIASEGDVMQVEQLVEDFKDLMGEIDEIVDMGHDVSFMDGHLDKIKSYVI